MNGPGLIEHRLLFSVFTDAHRPERRYLSRADLRNEYQTEIDTLLFNSIVSDLRAKKIIKAVPQGGTFAIRLHADAYKLVLEKILAALKADTLDIDWQTKRIFTDGDERDYDALIPCQNGWQLMQGEKKGQPQPDMTTTLAAEQTAGRDINHFHGPVHGHGVMNNENASGEGWWARWGTIFGGFSAAVAVAALAATWFFWRYPNP